MLDARMLTRKPRSAPKGSSTEKSATMNRQALSKKGKAMPEMKKASISRDKENMPRLPTPTCDRSSRSFTKRRESLYEFISDSPSDRPISNSKKPVKPRTKKVNNNKVKTEAKLKPSKLTSKATKKTKSDTKEKSITPKSQTAEKKVLRAVQTSVVTPVVKKKSTREHLKLSQPNLDDVSPITCMGSSKPKKCEKKSSPGQKRRREQSIDGGRELRSAKKMTPSLIETPPVSFTVTKSDFNDSAIFLEPKTILFKSTKTSTPALSTEEKRAKQAKGDKKKTLGCEPVITSTPHDKLPKSTFTKLKKKNKDMTPVTRVDNIKLPGTKKVTSPVVRVETPTSDYASMDSLDLEPSPSPLKQTSSKGFVPTPFFSLDDDSDLMNLNKSFDDRSYNSAKRSKKKIVSKNRRDSIIDEWADKVNSELEDVENFELSVEG